MITESCGTSMIGLLRKDEPEVIPTSFSGVNLKLSKCRPSYRVYVFERLTNKLT